MVATFRSEYLTSSPDRAGLADAADDVVVVEALGGSLLYDVILQPARRASLVFEAGLAENMVADAAGGDALPLLAYTLRELERQRSAGTSDVGRDPEIIRFDYEDRTFAIYRTENSVYYASDGYCTHE